MDETELFDLVEAALIDFFEADLYLLGVNANERSISHKLAEHLQKQKRFSEYHVDCEYNRHGDSVKKLEYAICDTPSMDDLEAKTVFPDIVVHERGSDDRNLLVIEIKKLGCGGGLSLDLAKLRAFTGEQYRYKVGLFLGLDVENKGVGYVKCFQNGKEAENTIWANLEGLGHGG